MPQLVKHYREAFAARLQALKGRVKIIEEDVAFRLTIVRAGIETLRCRQELVRPHRVGKETEADGAEILLQLVSRQRSRDVGGAVREKTVPAGVDESDVGDVGPRREGLCECRL
ncbi:MAG TPA: hypothetical protein VKF40_27695 [Burkholderiales bacterium]|nr:hypothetical protein [Burkholderiales bacterium]